MTDSDLLTYLEAAPSPYHAVAAAIERLRSAGWRELDLDRAWDDVTGRCYVAVGGALVAWARPAGLATSAPITLVGAHTDSPNLRVKPRPDTGGLGWRQLGIEVYGGALLNSWLDRDLGLSGRIVLRDGSVRLVRYDDAIARIPQLAIHLDRDVNERGVVLDKQQHMTPIWGLGPVVDGDFADWLAAEAAVPSGDLMAWDLMFHDLTGPRLLGQNRELLAGARIDNLFSCWCALNALVTSSDVGWQAICLFDHEEVGSDSTTGAGGPLLAGTLQRVVAAVGGDQLDFIRSMTASLCISADMAHSIHPNYPDRHEPHHRPIPNGGPVIKVNSNQRYATDAVSHARFAAACDRAGVPHQVFVSRNNQPCGSTIGPVTASRLGIPTVDVGCAQLSMHSARELCGAHDAALMVAALESVLVED